MSGELCHRHHWENVVQCSTMGNELWNFTEGWDKVSFVDVPGLTGVGSRREQWRIQGRERRGVYEVRKRDESQKEGRQTRRSVRQESLG